MVEFKLNGKPISVDADPDMPLLWAIRETAQITGTKFGCGVGECGACTVHIDGEATRSCMTPVSLVAGKAITTIEGIAGKEAQAVRAAWRQLDVVQCGYCQSGQIMSAVALLARNPKPSDRDIDQAMNGNICRCATYGRIRTAIHAAAKSMEG
jgi:isoquinoline 1-oxidoreductase alpha subunit